MTHTPSDQPDRRSAALIFLLAPVLILNLAVVAHGQGPNGAESPRPPRM